MVDARVTFCDQVHRLSPTRAFTFGRSADLVLDDNPYLHRNLGRIQRRDDVWWLRNVGSTITISVSDRGSMTQVKLAPGSETSLNFGSCLLQFRAGRTAYELAVDIDLDGLDPPVPDEAALAAEATLLVSDIRLNPDQKLLVVALAEPRLSHTAAGPADLPTNREVAQRLGWRITKLNRKLDHLCEKFARHGVAGVTSGPGGIAKNRRLALVDAALAAGLVGEPDLNLIADL